MTDDERIALAMLRSGSSYGDAMERTGLTLEHLQQLWKERDQ